MSPLEINVKINIARREMEFWQGILRDKSCKDCINFPEGVCKLAGGQVPPPDVQKVGCPAWEYDEIPF